jgi:hypothetical protein
MNKREDLISVLGGGTPHRTPYTVLDWTMQRAISSEDVLARMNDDDWRRLLDMGLTIRHHCATVRAIEHGVEYTIEAKSEGNDVYCIETKNTPVGSIRKVARNRWHYEDWVKTAHDYKVAQWIVEHTELVPDYEPYERAEQAVGEHGFVCVTGHGRWLHRTPLMSINIDYAGTEQFCMDLALEVRELFELHEAQEKLFLEEQRLIAAGPGRYVIWCENLTSSMLGPQRYADLIMPVYRKAVPVHEAGGKRVLVHYDGALSVIADEIARAPFHIIDSLTEPPEGDMTCGDCRLRWPDKVLLNNLNMHLYELPADQLSREVIDRRMHAGKRGLAFQVSEDLPANWRQCMPIVLQTLAELD